MSSVLVRENVAVRVWVGYLLTRTLRPHCQYLTIASLFPDAMFALAHYLGDWKPLRSRQTAKVTDMKPLSVVAIAVVALSVCLAAAANAQPATQKVTPTELLSKKTELANKPVTVEGFLTNAGTNFFTDRRVVLKDDKNARDGVLVQPWLPAATPPPPPGAQSSTATLSDYLGRKVAITGVLKDGVVKNVGPTKVLHVQSVTILSD